MLNLQLCKYLTPRTWHDSFTNCSFQDLQNSLTPQREKKNLAFYTSQKLYHTDIL